MLQITHIAVQYTFCLGIIDLQKMKYNIFFLGGGGGGIIICDSSIHKMDYPENSIGLKRAIYILLKCALELFNFAMSQNNHGMKT